MVRRLRTAIFTGRCAAMTWSDTSLSILDDNDVRLITYVPGNVLTPLINGIAADTYFLALGATREDEAIGAVTSAYMAGVRGALDA
jgi:sulfopyruvate decarboxylase TPP-binding subunit